MIWNGKRRFEFAKGLVLSSIVALLAVPTLKVQEKRDIYQILINGETGVEFGNFVLDIPYEANNDYIK